VCSLATAKNEICAAIPCRCGRPVPLKCYDWSVARIRHAEQRCILSGAIVLRCEDFDAPLAFLLAADKADDAVDCDGIASFIKPPDQHIAIVDFHRQDHRQRLRHIHVCNFHATRVTKWSVTENLATPINAGLIRRLLLHWEKLPGAWNGDCASLRRSDRRPCPGDFAKFE
jgi:hypothetical protein